MLTRKRSLAWLSGALLAFTASPLYAQGTPEEREACTPDVFRLCSSFIPDPTTITACLKRRRAELSDGCRKVVFPAVRLDESGLRPNLQPQIPR